MQTGTLPTASDDARYLRRALALARRGRTSPNPMVGAVVVRDGVVVGEGFHPKAGEPHAEVFALRAAGEQARGATLYVTLEPCAHYGRTPPCADAVLRAGVRRVVIASEDPNPLVAGRGLERLRAAGIEVASGLLHAQEARLNEAWRHWIVTRRPFVTLKLAASLDGKLATRTGDSRWITGEAARHDVHRLRAASDAILTTAATVLADDPALTARLRGAHQPRRVVVDARLRTSPAAQVYAPANRPPLLATLVEDTARLAPYRERGVDVLTLPARDGHVDLPALLAALGEREIVSLMVESGGTFAAALLAAGGVQKLRLYQAPLLIGGETAVPALGGLGVARLADAPRLYNITWKRIGEDFRVEGYL
ncbi:MAG: bifunctional diaminohydroxyphosphoribosylaminopyrimidine deaminase/5-amino-6-(5-phosphoribosylamino)uracil reductase RibD [Armatimonadota bacterium]